ncbi:hypothetical protein N0V90_001837 [Kalmusia sp. IMI 367209]|nr:hypothetical protein N0V90_001837 [Kalmusia sp. IMI 367209]
MFHEILAYAKKIVGLQEIVKALDDNEVDVVLGPGDRVLFQIAGAVGYPVATLPLGYIDFNGRPFGLQMTTKAYQEALIVQVQGAWEATFPKHQAPPLGQVMPGMLRRCYAHIYHLIGTLMSTSASRETFRSMSTRSLTMWLEIYLQA